MIKNNYNLGGEKSGHIILLDYNPTGDGILTSLLLIKILLEKRMKASELVKDVKMFPQVLLNAKVTPERKMNYKEDENVKNAIKQIEEELLGNGRVVIRESGTEPLVRIMLEGENQKYLEEKAKEIVKLIEKN